MTKLHQARLHRFAWLLAAMLSSAAAYADDVQVDGAWTRATVPGQKSAAVFLFVASKQEAKLTGASSPASGAVELRTMEHKGGMMKTITVDAIPLPAGKRVDMTSIHGYHLALTGLNAPLQAGASVPLTLNIEMPGKQGLKVAVQAEVRPPRTTTQ